MPHKLFNLKTVTLLTGINEHTLRTWESRHQALEPERTTSGRRAYRQDHIDRIRRLMTLCEQGHAIGGIAKLTDPELSRLLTQVPTPTKDAPSALHAESIAALLELMNSFSLLEFHSQLKRRLHQQGGKGFIFETVSPLMGEIGSSAASGSISIAHEHAVSAVIRAILFELLFSLPHSRHEKLSRTVVFATMEGDHHEIGILSAAVLAKIEGHHCIYIGANTPPEALALATKALNATDVVIGLVEIHRSLLRYSVRDYVTIVAGLLPQTCRILLGSASSTAAESLQDLPTARLAPSFAHLVEELRAELA